MEFEAYVRQRCMVWSLESSLDDLHDSALQQATRSQTNAVIPLHVTHARISHTAPVRIQAAEITKYQLLEVTVTTGGKT